MKEIESLRPGMLLVATPDLRDPHFRRTVVYLVAHGSDGTVGVILNRPSETAVQNVLPSWASHTSRPHAVFVGSDVPGGVSERHEPEGARRGGGRHGPSCAGGSGFRPARHFAVAARHPDL